MKESIDSATGWEKLQDGFAKLFALEDGAKVIAFVEKENPMAGPSFFAEEENLEQIETRSKELGKLSDFIERLQPEDIIEICCLTGKLSKEGLSQGIGQ